MPETTLFLTLRIFSATGGIEKVSRVAGKALYELAGDQPGEKLSVFSMYDMQEELDEKYFPDHVFKGFGKNKLQFVYTAIREGVNSKQVILSHINLLVAGFLIKLFSPKTRLILIAHGIEVWKPVSFWKKLMLGKCDEILAVSKFTKTKMATEHGIPASKLTVFNNCLDPFLQSPLGGEKDAALLAQYGLSNDNIILITLTRLSSKERYKGYDNVLYAIKGLKVRYPSIKYLIVGKYDEKEKLRVDSIIAALELQDSIIFTGFIPDEELAIHYNIADIYVMPSKKEGFGIVFIEAMYYGKPVIAGNKDGSADALGNGQFGILIDPDDKQEIANAVITVINNKAAFIPNIDEVMRKFSYQVYKENLKRILNRE